MAERLRITPEPTTTTTNALYLGKRLHRKRQAKALWSKVGSALRQFTSPAKPVLKNLASVPLTVAGLAGVDFAAFHIAHGWGFLVTGLSLMWLEHVIADEEG